MVKRWNFILFILTISLVPQSKFNNDCTNQIWEYLLFDVNVQTFLTIDPLQLNVNPLEFVNNDPVNTVDRNGKCPICGAGAMCTNKYNIDNERFVVNEYIDGFVERFGLQPEEASLILKMSNLEHWVDHRMHDSEMRFSDDLKFLNRRMVELRRSYVNEFPERFRTIVGHAPMTGDLALLQPLKFVELAQEKNVPLTLWKRTERRILRRQVPSLYEWSMESISKTDRFRVYASKFSDEMRIFNAQLAFREDESLELLELGYGFDLNSAQLRTAVNQDYHRILDIDINIRRRINPSNPSLRGDFDIANRKPLRTYFSFRDNPTLGPNARSMAYFPEQVMGVNRANSLGSWYFPKMKPTL